MRSGELRPMDSWIDGPDGALNTGAGPRLAGTVSVTSSWSLSHTTSFSSIVCSLSRGTALSLPVATSPTHSSTAVSVRRFSRKRLPSGEKRSWWKAPPAGSATGRSVPSAPPCSGRSDSDSIAVISCGLSVAGS